MQRHSTMQPPTQARRSPFPALCSHPLLGDEPMTDLDTRALRDTMGQFATGVVVVAAVDAGELAGFAAQSFVSLSLEPPLIAVCPAKTSTSWPRVRAAGRFSVSMLASDQAEASNGFARAGQVADVRWRQDDHGVPMLEGALAYVAAELSAEHDAGDHTVAVAKVLGFATLRAEAAPLVFFRGGYGTVRPV